MEDQNGDFYPKYYFRNSFLSSFSYNIFTLSFLLPKFRIKIPSQITVQTLYYHQFIQGWNLEGVPTWKIKFYRK